MLLDLLATADTADQQVFCLLPSELAGAFAGLHRVGDFNLRKPPRLWAFRVQRLLEVLTVRVDSIGLIRWFYFDSRAALEP